MITLCILTICFYCSYFEGGLWALIAPVRGHCILITFKMWLKYDSVRQGSNPLYYIQSSEIQEYIDEIYCVFYIFTCENIKFYIFTPPECKYIFFWITSDFSIDLLQCTSELQTPITFLFVSLGMHFLN